MAFNMSAAKRRALVALQLRDKHGRFIDMGKSVKWYSTKHKSVVSGTVEDGKGTQALVRMTTGPDKGRTVYVEANQIEVIESKATLNPDAPKADAPEAPTPVEETAVPKYTDMADPQDKTGSYVPIISKTSDGNTYISAPEGSELYTPAKNLAVGDEVLAPDGADPKKPFSMGKSWPNKGAERVNTAGPKIGKVLSIKEHAYAVVQLPDGETVESTQIPGEQVNTVTIGLSNKVIKATPEMKAALKDVIPEPVYASPEAPAVNAEADAKKAKRLDLLNSSPKNTTVSAKDGSITFTKKPDSTWGSSDGHTGLSSEQVNDMVEEAQANTPEGAEPVGFTLEQPGAEEIGEVSEAVDYNKYVGDYFADYIKEEPTLNYSLKADEAFGDFDAFNPAELAAIRDYVGSSVDSNTALRKGGDTAPKTAETILGMDSILNKSVLQEDTKVYRGVGADAAMMDAILNNGIMRDRAFTSTSVDRDFADSWVANTGLASIKPVVMEINLPAGFKAHKVDYDAVGGGFDHENEVVLPRGLAFDITSVEEYTNASGQKGYRVQATPILNENNYDAGAIKNGTAGNTEPAGSSTEAPAESGNGSEQEVHDSAGTGGDSESGGSGDVAPAESGAPEEGSGNGPVAEEPKGVRRTRATIMAELQPMDTSAWKKVGAQAGSNPGGVFEDENGKQWYVKQSKSDSHARAEVLADQLYKASGIDASGLKLTTFNGKMGTASPMIEGAKSDLHSKYSDKAYMDKIREGFAVDAWLANWDVLGQGDDNIVTDANGNPVRIDTGGTMMYRAQGGLKNDVQTEAWGDVVKDWEGLRKIGEAQKAFKGMSDQQLVDSAARVEAVTPEEIDSMVDALGYTGAEAFNMKNTLKARREDIIKKASALGVEKSAPAPAEGDNLDFGDDPLDFGGGPDDAPETEAQPTASEPEAEADGLGWGDDPYDFGGGPDDGADNSTEAPQEQAPKLVEPTDAPVADDEPFEPILPSQQKAQQKAKQSFPKATKENPNVLQGYTIEKNADGVYFPKERLDMNAWNGLRKGTIVPPHLPFIPFDTDSGEVHYWDSKGNKHWGQFGGAGALTRRKNADGEYEYLLAQRASSLSTAPNMWSTPGGAHATKADSEGNGVTAKIELEEELGMVVHGDPIANYKHSTAPDWSYDYSIFDAPSDGEPDMDAVDKREIQDIKWMTADEIKELKDDGTLHPAMAEVLDDLLAASESVQTDDDEATTPESGSDAPEAPSKAVEEAPEADAPTADDSAEETLPKVETDGPSVTMADGKQAFVGSRVTHAKKGAGTVIKIIAGKSAKIEYDDGTSSIAQAHTINTFDGKVVANAPVDTSDMAPGEWGNNPANGKLFIVGSDGKALYQGDKVEAPHQGETKTGVIKGIYKTNNSIAIVFDGEKKPSTKKAAVAKSLEEQGTPAAPEETPDVATDAPKYNDYGLTEAETAKLDALESELAKGWTKEVSEKLDELYAKGDARLAGKDVPEDNAAPDAPEAPAEAPAEEAPALIEPDATPEDVPEVTPEPVVEPDVSPEEAPDAPVKAPEETPEPVEVPSEVADNELDGTDVPEEAPVAEKESPEAAPVDTEEPEISSTQMWEFIDKMITDANAAPDGSKLVSAKLGQTWTKDGYKWANNEGDEYYIDTIIGGSTNSLDWKITPPESKKLTAVGAPEGSVLSTGDGSEFTKNANGDWDLAINGKKFGIKATDEQIDEMSNRLGSEIKAPNGGFGTPDEALAALKKQLMGEEPEPELADWEKRLLNSGADSAPSEADVKAEASEAEAKADAAESPEASHGEELADWEKELLGEPVEKKNNFDDAPGDFWESPSQDDFKNFLPGTVVVKGDPDEYVYTKLDDGTWQDQEGNTFDAEEMANGSALKVQSYGGDPEEAQDEPDEFSDTLSKVKAFAIGTKLGNPKADHIRKTGENEWSSFVGNEIISDDEPMSDTDTAKFALEYPEEYGLQTVVNEDLFAMVEIANKLVKMPEGTMIGEPDSGNYVKQNGKWVGYLEKTKVDWEPEYSDQQMAQIVFHNQNILDIDNPVLPKDNGPIDDIVIPDIYNLPAAEAEAPKKSQMQIQQDLAKLPYGTKVGNPHATQWEKLGPDEWADHFQGEFQGSQTYTDWDIAELVGELPDQYGEHTFVIPEGKEVAEEKTAVGTLGGLDKAAFDAKPVGTKVVYSKTAKASEPTGIYEKTGPSSWSYTKDGSDTPSKNNLDGSIFDHLFSADVDNSKYSIDSKRSVGVDETPVDDTGILTEFDLSNATSALDAFPVGSTIKKNQHYSSYYPNDKYYVKQPDGSWQEYKKTPSKTMKGSNWASATLAAYGGLSTVSKPQTENHAVLATGEIAYVGDTVHDGPDTYTVDSIMKTGINVVGADGVKKKLKPHALKKDSEFGVGPSSKGHYADNAVDPLSSAAEQFAQKQHAKLIAKQEAEKLKQSLENFGGGTADEYDAQGLTMPSNPAPQIDNGLTVLDTGEPDKDDPLYGKPKPIKPSDESNYPAFYPPEAEPLPKWDSAAWLKKVEQRYIDNPNKAKSTVQESNKWSSIQTVLNGQKENLDNLVGSMYLDDDLRKEALDGIDAQEKANVPLKKKIVDDAKAAKDAYDAKKAVDLADLNKATEQYHTDLEAWAKANPSPDAYKKVKKPATSTQSFEGGEADWTKAHVGTYTAKTVMDSLRDDNLLGAHGLSIATDSDQIEDLDVKVTKVLDKNGDPKFEFKFKLTGPHGAAFEAALKADDKVIHDSSGIYPSNMVKDPSTGLFKDAGKPTSSNYINEGTRYSYTDPMTGAKVVFQRASHTSGLNVSSNNNTVKIHMPVDSTPEQYQQTLENLGIKKARPSTAGDLRVLAENKLLYLMGTSKNGVDVIDGNINMTGEDRKSSLQEIKDTYGVTPDDMTFSTEPNGRVRFFLSEEKAEELAKKYNVSHFYHDVKGGGEADTWVNMMSGKNPGMLSTYHRFTEGINKGGKSSWQDMGSGAGDYNYVTPKSPNADVSSAGIFIKPTSIFKRTDFWANPGDGWGKKSKSSNGDESNKAPYKLFDSKTNSGPTQGIGYQGWNGNGVYEVLPKDSIPITDWSHVVVPSHIHQDVIDKLIAKGILEINGLPLDQFIIKPGQTPPVDLTVAGTA